MRNDVKNSPNNKKNLVIHKNHRNGLCRKILPALIAGCFACGPVEANPTGAQVVSGQVSMTSSGNTLTITNSPGSIISWQSFSINPGELTQFLQQSSSSSVLNRIVGQNPSQIFGALQSNGKVYLINPNGVLFGRNSQVNVAGLVASSLDITNGDFTAGKLNFNAGTSAGAVTNQGSITTPAGGQVYLIAPQVQNNGIITSPQGEVLLAAGHSVQLVDGGNPDIQVVISAPTDQAVNLGSVVSQGGKIGIYGALVNQGGIVNADSAVVGQNGEILFKASGTTTLAGNSQTTAIGSGNGTTGGTVDVLGAQVSLTDNAQINVSGQNGGGSVVVGGYPHGENPSFISSANTSLGANASINANAITNGNGGNVMVSSVGTTLIAGSINAQGGSVGGNGGVMDTSGAQLHVLDGSLISTTAAKGLTGSWLLDPQDFTVAESLTTGCGCSLTTTADITGVTLGLNLASNNVTILSSQGINSGQGNINVNAPVTWSGNTMLTLTASNNVNINSAITASGNTAGLVINPNTANGSETASGHGTLLFGVNGSSVSMSGTNAMISIAESGGAANLGSITMTGNNASLTIGVTTSSVPYTLNSGASITLSGTSPSLSIDGHNYTVINSSNTSGAGLGLSGSMTGTDLQGINGNLSGYYALGTDLTASGTNAGSNFTPIGSSSQAFSGVFDGMGHTISNLVINQPSLSNVGLIGYMASTASMRNVNVTGTVSGQTDVGGLVGYQNGGAIATSTFNGTVSGSGNDVGGVVGYNNSGAIGGASFSGTVSGASDVGGVVGYNSLGYINNSSFNSGTVIGTNYVGGLVGYNSNGTIFSNDIASGTVSGAANVGGLVGYNTGSIDSAYAYGTVSGSGNNIGGLVGYNSGSINNSYAYGSVTGNGNNTGGLVGYNLGSISNSRAFGNVNGNGEGACTDGGSGCFVGGVAGYNNGTISNSGYQNATIDGNGYIGGVVGRNDSSGMISASTVNATNVYANNQQAGGLAGENSGTITGSSFIGGTVIGSAFVGGLAGNNSGAGVISSSYATVTVSSSGNNVGGLVGANYGSISNSYFTSGSVSGNNNVGGLVGYNFGGSIQDSSANNVNVSGVNNVGGLVGLNYGSVTNSYAIATVVGSTSVGGLIGANGVSGEVNAPTVSNSYVVGSISGSTNVGGFVGYNYGSVSATYASVTISSGASAVGGFVGTNDLYGNITSSYWNSGIAANGSLSGIGIGNAPGIGALTNMFTAANFIGFNFTTSTTTGQTGNNWVLVDVDGTLNNFGSTPAGGATFPMLASEYATTITNGHQLQLMVMDPTATYMMANSGTISVGNTGIVGSDVWGSAGFIPVGNATTNFTGIFNGQSATISGLHINQPNVNNVGLFGVVGSSATINSITLNNVTVSGGANVGGLVGTNYGTVNSGVVSGSGSITGLYNVGGLVGSNKAGATINNGNVYTIAVYGSASKPSTSNANVGGLVGANYGTINSGFTSGVTVSAQNNNVGGLVGLNYGTITSGSASSVTVSSQGNAVGGLVGVNYGSISSSNANGNVNGNSEGSSYIGGLVGLNTGSITGGSFFSTGYVNGSNYVGGLVGKNTGTITGSASGFSYAGGTVSASQNYAGGLVGGNVGTLENPAVINYGRVQSGSLSGNFAIGGLVGYNEYGAINKSYSTVNISVSGATSVGGLVGKNGNSEPGNTSISNSFATGSVTTTGNSNPNQVGGLVGYNYGSISDSYATGGVSGHGDVGGLVGNNASTGVITNTYASGSAAGAVSTGGLVGTNTGSVSNSFYNNINASGVAAGSGTVTAVLAESTNATGLMNLSNFSGAGWNITGTGGNGTSTTWLIYNGYTMPLLTTFLSPLTVQATSQTVTYTGLPTTITSLSMPTYNGNSSMPENVFGPENGIYNGATNAGTYTPALYSNQFGYNISYAAGTCSGTLTILPATLTVSGSSASSKVYNGTTDASVSGGTLSGVLGGDVISLVQSGQFANKNVGTNITVNANDSLTGAAAGNYILVQPSGLSANITPATLTVTGGAATSKVYDGTTTDVLTGGVLTGTVMPGDSLSLVQAGTFASKNVGTGIAVTPTDSLTGVGAGNYILVQPTASLTANITPATLTITGATANNKVYDGTTTETVSGTLTGIIGGDAVTVSQNATFATKNVGTGIAVTATGSLSGADAGNYTLVEPTGLTANITPLALSVSATGTNKVYDGTVNDVVSLSGTGVIAGDNVSFSDTSASFANKNVGTGKTVVVAGLSLSGADAGNYTLTNTTATTVANITPATLTVSGETANNKVYDGTTTATLTGGTLNGVVPGDVATLTQAGSFASSNVGNNIPVTANNSLSGTDAANYTLVQPTGLMANIIGTPVVNVTPSQQEQSAINITGLYILGSTPTLNGVPTGGNPNSGFEIFPTNGSSLNTNSNTTNTNTGANNNGTAKKLYCD